MHLAKLTMSRSLLVLFVVLGLQLTSNAQDQSPYSRYGLGDIAPKGNIFSRGMGGISAAVADLQNINLVNPAALGAIRYTIFDLGIDANVRTLKTTTPAKRSTAYNAIFSYLQLAFPVTPGKLAKKGINWNMSFGIKPVTRIDYNIADRRRLAGVDSIYSLYNGTGGITQVNLGNGFEFTGDTSKGQRFRVGFNAGYMFGTKNYSTKITMLNDTVDYYRSNSENNTHFGGLFFNAGVQFDTRLGKGFLSLGLYGNLQQRLNAKQDYIRETFSYDATGATYTVDSVYKEENVKGTIVFPSSVGFGFTYQKLNWLFGGDIELTNWANYMFYRQPDAVQNSWTGRIGVQYTPDLKQGVSFKRNFFRTWMYRAGAYYGPDYVKVTATRPAYGITAGASIPLLRPSAYKPETATLHFAVDVGGRGDKNVNLRESIMRYSIGLSMNALWFRKPKYD